MNARGEEARTRAVSRTMLRIARRTMRPDLGLTVRDAAKTPLQDEGMEPSTNA